MKSLEKVIYDSTKKIESNGLSILEYKNQNDIKCQCNKCEYIFSDNHRNLTYKKFNCKYCDLIQKSNLISDGLVRLIKISGTIVTLQCTKSNHVYKQDKRNLLSGRKCEQCRKTNKKIQHNELLQKFKYIHGDFFEYDISEYKTLHSKIKIKCKKGHSFLQKVSNHLQGKGCPICRESTGERKIRILLEEYKIKFVTQKKFECCKFINPLPFDFFLPDFNILIEYDGLQHFQPIKQFGGESEFIKTLKKDKIKTEFCLNNNIKLIRISYKDNIKEKLLSINELVVF